MDYRKASVPCRSPKEIWVRDYVLTILGAYLTVMIIRKTVGVIAYHFYI